MSPKPLRYAVHTYDEPTTDQRLDEVAGLLAAGLLRLRLRSAAACPEPQKTSQNRLDSSANQSVHAARTRV